MKIEWLLLPKTSAPALAGEPTTDLAKHAQNHPQDVTFRSVRQPYLSGEMIFSQKIMHDFMRDKI